MKFLLMTTILLFSKVAFTQVFEPFVIIDPPQPMVGDTIRVGVAHTFHPPCLTLPATNFEGLTHLFQFVGNDIRLTAVDDSFSMPPICFPFPISPAPRAYYELGNLPEGSYTLETWIGSVTVPLPIPESGFFPLVYGPTFAFEVTRPLVIDTLSNQQYFILIFFIIMLTFIGVKFKIIHLNYP